MEEKTRPYFDRGITALLKGTALVLMFFHHFFTFPAWITVPVSDPFIAYVAPHLVPRAHMLSNVSGVMNAVAIRGNAVGEEHVAWRIAGRQRGQPEALVRNRLAVERHAALVRRGLGQSR